MSDGKENSKKSTDPVVQEMRQVRLFFAKRFYVC